MKRIIALVLSFVFVMSFAGAAFADDTVNVYIDGLGMNVSIPADYVILTQEMDEDDPALAAIGLTADYLVEYLQTINAYLDAWDDGVAHELVITMTENVYEDLGTLGSAMLRLVQTSTEGQYANLGYEVYSNEITEIDGITYMVLRLGLASDKGIDYILQYFTIVDHMAINFVWHNYREEPGSFDEDIMEGIVGSVVFGEPLAQTSEKQAARNSSDSSSASADEGSKGGSRLGTH